MVQNISAQMIRAMMVIFTLFDQAVKCIVHIVFLHDFPIHRVTRIGFHEFIGEVVDHFREERVGCQTDKDGAGKWDVHGLQKVHKTHECDIAHGIVEARVRVEA